MNHLFSKIMARKIRAIYSYALTAPEVIPSMYSLELNENISRSGTVAITKPAIIAP